VNTDSNTDRRSSDRFSIERDVRYKVLNKKNGEEAGTGRTVNMSSTGVLITTDQMLLPSRRIEVSISWPAELNGKCALRLVATGRVVRFGDGKAAIEIQQHEFRTQAKAATAPVPGR
jgi:c-di-GMP-binding flagellar brake protein YcgR